MKRFRGFSIYIVFANVVFSLYADDIFYVILYDVLFTERRKCIAIQGVVNFQNYMGVSENVLFLISDVLLKVKVFIF